MIYHSDMSTSSVRLAVLGMLKLRPMTGYEVRQAYQRGPANFMPMSFGQIYPVLAELRKKGMVRQEKQGDGRGSIRYTITAKGEEAFREWQFSPADASSHRELLLRLFFASPSELPQLAGHVDAYRRHELSAIEHYDQTRKWLDEIHGDSPRLPVWKLVMEFGVLESQYRIRWAEQALAVMTNQKRSQG